MSTALKSVPVRTLDAIEEDLAALDSLLFDLGGDITEEEAAAAIDQWFAELGEARDKKLDAYAWRIRLLDSHAAAKAEEAKRLAAAKKREETQIEWLKRRLLSFVQRTGQSIKGKETHQVETSLHRFVETMNGGKRSLTYLVEPQRLPAAMRAHTISLHVPGDSAEEVLATVLRALDEKKLVGQCAISETASPIAEEVRAALERGEEARTLRLQLNETAAKVGHEGGASVAPLEPLPDEAIFAFARLEPRSVRLEIR